MMHKITAWVMGLVFSIVFSIGVVNYFDMSYLVSATVGICSGMIFPILFIRIFAED